MVGVFPNYATAYTAWKAKAQQTVDNAQMRYFIVHLHRLLDPDARRRSRADRTTERTGMLSLKRIARTRWVQKTIGVVAAEYLRLVYWTSRLVTEPADIYERVVPDLPVILAMWHGQHFMAPFIKRPHLPARR